MSEHRRTRAFLVAIVATLMGLGVVLMAGVLRPAGSVFPSPPSAGTTPGIPSSSEGPKVTPTRPPASPDPSTSASPPPPVALGVFVPGAASDPARIDTYADLVGGMPKIVLWYQPWNDGGSFYTDTADAIRERGATPLVTWEPWDGRPTDPKWTLRTILDGKHDAYIRRWARDAAAWGHPVYVRLMHEMNGRWSAWSPNVNGNTTAEFVPAWRHIVDTARAEGASNIVWVWSPNIDHGNRGYAPYADVYPGDDYVDWAALDGFNWGTSQGAGGKWFDFKALFQASIDQLRDVTDKPLMIAETSSAEEGGDKAAWIRDGLRRLPELLPDVRAVIWFHTYEARTDVDWSVDSSVGSLRAFRELVASDEFQGSLP